MEKQHIEELKRIRIRISEIYYSYFNNKEGEDFEADVILREEIKVIENGSFSEEKK